MEQIEIQLHGTYLHDLVKDPEDLPPKDRSIILYYQEVSKGPLESAITWLDRKNKWQLERADSIYNVIGWINLSELFIYGYYKFNERYKQSLYNGNKT